MRRVVTGLNAQGKSCVLTDEPVPDENPSAVEIWQTTSGELEQLTQTVDPRGAAPIGPPPGGVAFRKVRFPPYAEYLEQLSRNRAPNFGERGYHITRTIDYFIVLKGETYLDLDVESVLLREGDCLVQQATGHAWRSEHGVELLGMMIAGADEADQQEKSDG